ncbi:MAG TPA: SGNH/GDSL hydrolase family protein [Acidimicrobiales bacterium]|nr:SGNH/GDSL hydrolase family protein [Acidimicrobiales bacterium]
MTVTASPLAGHASGTVYYLSLGDSYSVGYQPAHGATPAGASSGYTAVVAANKGLQLENFGCGGATTTSILAFDQSQCGVTQYGPPAATDAGPVASGQTQVQAADAFIAANPGQVGLITISIGGNDVTPCAAAAPGHPVNGKTDPVSCVGAGDSAIQANVATLVGDLEGALIAANGTKGAKQVPIVGLTYPDVLLGLWVNSGPGGSPANTPKFPASASNQTLASESVAAFNLLINPTLKAAYATVKGKFVDVTKGTHAYTPLTKTTRYDASALGLGTITIPKAVADVCTWTWYCQYGNIHANDTGYTLIGNLIDKTAKVKI